MLYVNATLYLISKIALCGVGCSILIGFGLQAIKDYKEQWENEE